MRIYESERLFARGRELSPYFLDAMFGLQDLGVVADVRGYGMLAGVEVKAGKAPGCVNSSAETGDVITAKRVTAKVTLSLRIALLPKTILQRDESLDPDSKSNQQ